MVVAAPGSGFNVRSFASFPRRALVGFEGLKRKVAIVQTSTPSAVLPLRYALCFGTRPDWIASAIRVTTLRSGVSLSVVLCFLV